MRMIVQTFAMNGPRCKIHVIRQRFDTSNIQASARIISSHPPSTAFSDKGDLLTSSELYRADLRTLHNVHFPAHI